MNNRLAERPRELASDDRPLVALIYSLVDCGLLSQQAVEKTAAQIGLVDDVTPAMFLRDDLAKWASDIADGLRVR